jgi:hypothetical protein
MGDQHAGRICPRCGTQILAGASIVECAGCRAVHHHQCYLTHGGCAVAGCHNNPLSGMYPGAPARANPSSGHAGMPPGAPPAPHPSLGPPGPGAGYPVAVYGQPPAPRPTRTLAIALTATLLALLVIGAGVAVAIAGNGGGPSTTSSTPTAKVLIAPISPGPTSKGSGRSAHHPRSTASSTAPSTTSPPPNPTASATTPSGVAGTVTGRDAQGYNVGVNCSDNPSAPQPGCSDSPSTPNGGPEGPCANGVTVDRQTTSCGLAQNVQSAYTSDGQLTALSPERNQSYSFSCQTGGPGTTGMTICQGQAGSATLYVRWHK